MNKLPAAITRRDFLRTSATASIGAVTLLAAGKQLFAAGNDRKLRVGVIGCGGRGTGAAHDCIKAAPDRVVIVALGDLFKNRLDGCRNSLKGAGAAYAVTDEHCFVGFDAYQKVIASDVDLILMATPPGFRPIHFEAAIAAGKHVFMEKPVCVDSVGYRKVIAAAELATQKKLCVVAGTQRRHADNYQATIKRIRDGAIGEIVAAQCYWVGGPVHHRGEQTAGMSDIEFQCRNWYNWTWLCGDHIVEQHVHNIDVINWAIGALPVKAMGQGGRQARKERGNIWDHFAIEFEYPNDVRVASYCAHFDGINGRVSERVVGTLGDSNCVNSISGKNAWRFTDEKTAPYVQEHIDLIAAIRGEAPYVNEGKQVADSTMCAVLGRMAAYTGREISWKWITEASKLDLMPPKFEFGAFEAPPIAVPGVTQLV